MREMNCKPTTINIWYKYIRDRHKVLWKLKLVGAMLYPVAMEIYVHSVSSKAP